VRVDEFDARTASDEQLHVLHTIEQACLTELVPGEPGRTVEETIGYYRYPPSTHERHHWIVGEAGFAALYVHTPSAVFVDLLVAPEYRRRGVGTLLVDAMRSRAADLGLAAVYGQHATAGGAAFAARLGAADGQRDVRSLLELGTADLPSPDLQAGWTVMTWIGSIPETHVASYARARAAMDDAPVPDGVEIPAGDDVGRIRAMEESLRLRGRELRLTVALDAHGEIAAFSDLRVSTGSRVAFTDDTGTVAAHRGRGLATAVKLESLRALRRDHPQVEMVTTTNAESNAAMRRINERIGFRVAAIFTTARLEL
jgi:mycothiol synthase